MRGRGGTRLGPARKRTRLKSTKKSLCEALNQYQCQCPEGAHVHVRGKSGTEFQNYPRQMCRLLATQMSLEDMHDEDIRGDEHCIEVVEALGADEGARYPFNLAYHLVLDEPRMEQGLVTENGEKDKARSSLKSLRTFARASTWGRSGQ